MSKEHKRDADRAASDRVDVCIIGAGVAGAVVADFLSDCGYDVIVLEAGPRFEFESRLERMERALRPEFAPTDVWEMGGSRDDYTTSGEIDYKLNETRVKGVGGTTLHWLGTTPRLHQKDFEMASRFGVASDWPISYRDLQPYYAEAEAELGVAGASDNPFGPPRETPFPMEAFPPSQADALYSRACESLGISLHSVPQARNSTVYDDRSQCVGYSTCSPVCPSGAKYSGDVHVQKAEENGAKIVDRVPVQRLEHDRSGDRVEAAVYVTPDGNQYRQEARVFVLACGAVEIPRLLLLSRSDQYPAGLANSSGLVGKYFMEHPIVRTTGVVGQETNPNPVAFYTSASQQFYEGDGTQSGSMTLMFANDGPDSPVDMSLKGGDSSIAQELLDVISSDSWGDELLEDISGPIENHRVGVEAMVEQLPNKENRVTLDSSTTDEYGNPVPDLSLSLYEHEKETMRRALKIQTTILEEMGATITNTRGPAAPLFGAHHMGTTRMGDDPETSVVTPNQRTHDLKNLYIASSSVFVTAGAVNPTLTIAALSLRLANHLDNML